jgi:hypothetical protein
MRPITRARLTLNACPDSGTRLFSSHLESPRVESAPARQIAREVVVLLILFITLGVSNPMQWPLRNKKVRGITAIVLFLIISLVMLLFVQHESPEEKAIREYFDVPKRTVWSLWPLYLVLIGGACIVYIMVFKVEERRKKYLGMLLLPTCIFCITLIPSWWNWAIGMVAMVAIVLIAWLYPARAIRRQ